MTSSKIDAKINVDGTQNKQLYSTVSFSFQFHKEKLIKINQTLSDICSSNESPFLLFQLPTMDFKGLSISTFKQQVFEHKQIIKNNKLYHLGNLKSAQTTKFIKTLQKSFQKLTELDNFCKLEISLYDVSNIKTKSQLWNKGLIRGQTKIDKQFIEIFKDLLKNVSPQFIDSPIVILLQYLEIMDISVDLSSFDLFSGQIRQLMLGIINLSFSTQNQFSQLLQKTEEDITVRITLGHLLFFKVKGPSKAIAKLLKFI